MQNPVLDPMINFLLYKGTYSVLLPEEYKFTEASSQ